MVIYLNCVFFIFKEDYVEVFIVRGRGFKNSLERFCDKCF